MRTKPSEVDLEMRNPSQRATIRLCYTPAPWMTPNSVGFLLIIAASHPSLSAGQQPFTVNITQRVYEMEEQENVTLTISFPTDPAAPPQPLHVDLMYIEPVLSVYTYNNAQGAREYVHHDYDGRLRCSQFASEGRVVFSITGLKMNDSSTYRCLIISGSKSNFTDFKLVVTVVPSRPEGGAVNSSLPEINRGNHSLDTVEAVCAKHVMLNGDTLASPIANQSHWLPRQDSDMFFFKLVFA